MVDLLQAYQAGRLNDAEKLALSLTQNSPAHPLGWTVLGAVFAQTGKQSEALIINQKVVKITPRDAQAHSNLGVTLKELGRLEEAEASHRKAIALKADYPEAHNNLGIALKELGRLEEAEASYRQAIALKDGYAKAYNNLGNVLKEMDRRKEAIDAYTKALYLRPNYVKAYSNIGQILTGLSFKKPEPNLQKIIISILDKKTLVRPRSISNAAISLLRFEPILIEIFEKHSKKNLMMSLQETISNLSEFPLLLKLMSVCPLDDLEFEKILTDVRSSLLLCVSEMAENSDLLQFQSALALQCFTNEYLYDQSETDSKMLRELEAKLEKTLSNGDQPTPHVILCVASYKALHNYEWCNLLIESTEIKEVLIRQVYEPKKESYLKKDFPTLDQITDKVSKQVKQQYEGNPYPRWMDLQLRLDSIPISTFFDQSKLRIFDKNALKVEAPEILVAGCGTGQHSIETAVKFKNSKVLAIDISLASLAYARRKTQELGIKNVEYMQADILDLAKLERQFDIVESAGVLHHMDDPMDGWKALTDCLKPGGLMYIGLYSELARQHIVKIRKEISQSDLGSSDNAMKLFRREILSSNEAHHKQIRQTSDFYSMSELRDLLFHVQEHRFTLPQIQLCLSKLGLNFCGFQSKRINHDFKLVNTGTNDPYDLDKWNEYENANPNTFAGMYLFWCQKAG